MRINPPYDGSEKAHDADADAAAIGTVLATQGDATHAITSHLDSTPRLPCHGKIHASFSGGMPLDPDAADPCGGRTVTVCVDAAEYGRKPEGSEVAAVSNRIAEAGSRMTVTIPELALMVSKGRTVMPGVCEGWRAAGNWRRQELFFVDVDNDGEAKLTEAEAVARAYDSHLPLVMSYPTFRSGGGRERFRLVFASPAPVTEPEAASDFIAKLLAHYPEADARCKDLSRMFYGTRGTVEVWDALSTARDLTRPLGALPSARDLMPRERFLLPDRIEEGDRNETLFKYAAQLRAKGYGDEELLDAVTSANEARCAPPLPTAEIEKTVHSALKYPRGEADGSASGDKRRPRVLIADIEGKIATDDEFSRSLAYNELKGKAVVTGPLPWDGANDREREWDSRDDSFYMRWLQEAFGRDVTKDNAFHALNVHAIGNSFNPLTERLEELAAHKVDKPLAKTLPYFLLGVPEGDVYAQQVWCAFMRAAVLRAFEPGAPVQWMPVLYGPQGCGKSYAARLMAMSDEWFVDSVTDVADPKALTEATAGRWICELAELAGLSRRRMEATKAAITRTEDICREAYARKAESHPRRFVFIGTTNDHGFLCDETGERRFYPITCATTRPGINLATENEKARGLIRWAWGEVAAQYLEARRRADSRDELLRFFPPEPPAETQREAERVRAEFKEPNPQREVIEAYLEERHPKRVCVEQVAREALGLTREDILTNGHASHAYKNVQGLLDNMPGWHRAGKQRTGYGTVLCWELN